MRSWAGYLLAPVVAAISSAAATVSVFTWIGYSGDLCPRILLSGDRLAEQGYERWAAGRLGGSDGAIALFKAAVARDAASPYRWCDLGEAILEHGETGQARRCIARALELGPHVAPILMRAANFYYRTGETGAVLVSSARILDEVPEFRPAVFGLYDRMGITVDQALDRGVPPKAAPAAAYFQHLVATARPPEVRKAWNWMTSRALVDDVLADAYARRLLKDRQFQDAADVWAAQARGRDGYSPECNPVYNGGFERPGSDTVFDWTILPVPGAEAARDRAASASGKWSLRISFDGTGNVVYGHVFQRMVVRPGPYKFEAWLRTEGITTDQGVAFRISDREAPARLDLRTERFTGTREWQRVERRVLVPTDTRLLEIQVVRAASLKFDDSIRGVVWIDSIRLIPLSEAARCRT